MKHLDLETIHALRRDVALQIARRVQARRQTQVAVAQDLGIPQPTLSKIMNGNVSDLSLELLIRIAVRSGLQLVLQTGGEPSEVGAFVAGRATSSRAGPTSKVADAARESLLDLARQMTPEQRLDAQLRHSELVTELHHAGRRLNDMRIRTRRRSS
jgi:predicted XRE-type DNA-binding protein